MKTFSVLSLALTSLLATTALACSGTTSTAASASPEALAADTQATDQGFIVTNELVAAPGQEDALKAALAGVVGRTRTEDDVRYANVHQDVDDPTQFFAFGVWTSEAAFQAHLAQPYVQAFGAALANLVAAPPKLTKYTAVASLDLDHIKAVAEDPDARYTLVRASTKTDEERETFADLVLGLIPTFRAQDGSRFYDILRTEDPRGIVSYEAWSTQDAEDAHLKTEPVQEFLAAVGPTLEAPPVFRHFVSIVPAPAAKEATGS
jgi:quinol monooxygenase YgiN